MTAPTCTNCERPPAAYPGGTPLCLRCLHSRTNGATMGTRAAVVAHLQSRAPFQLQTMRALMDSAPPEARETSWTTRQSAAAELMAAGLLTRQRRLGDRAWLFSMTAPAASTSAPAVPDPAPNTLDGHPEPETDADGRHLPDPAPSAVSAPRSTSPAEAESPPGAGAAGAAVHRMREKYHTALRQRDELARKLDRVEQLLRPLRDERDNERARAKHLRHERDDLAASLADARASGDALRARVSKLEKELAELALDHEEAIADRDEAQAEAKTAHARASSDHLLRLFFATTGTTSTQDATADADRPAPGSVEELVDHVLAHLRNMDEERYQLQKAHDATAARLAGVERCLTVAQSLEGQPSEVIWQWIRQHGPVLGPVELTEPGEYLRRDCWGQPRLQVRREGDRVAWSVTTPDRRTPGERLRHHGTTNHWPAAVAIAERSATASGVQLADPATWTDDVHEMWLPSSDVDGVGVCANCGPVHMDPYATDRCPNCDAPHVDLADEDAA